MQYPCSKCYFSEAHYCSVFDESLLKGVSVTVPVYSLDGQMAVVFREYGRRFSPAFCKAVQNRVSPTFSAVCLNTNCVV